MNDATPRPSVPGSFTMSVVAAALLAGLAISCSGNNFAGSSGTQRSASPPGSPGSGSPGSGSPGSGSPGSPGTPLAVGGAPGTDNLSLPVGTQAPADPKLNPTSIVSCTSSDPSVAAVNATTCNVIALKPGSTTVLAKLNNGTTESIPVQVTPTVDNAGANGGTPGLNTDGGSASGTQPESAVTADGGLVVNVPVKRLHIDTLIDHDSILNITPTAIFWEHHALGAPAQTTISLFDAQGNLINATPWVPTFAPNQGSNCPQSLFKNGNPYCPKEADGGCTCLSNQIQLNVPPGMTGVIANVTAQGAAPNALNSKGRDPSSETGGISIQPGSPILVHILDCGDDCGRSGLPGLSGFGEYIFDVQ